MNILLPKLRRLAWLAFIAGWLALACSGFYAWAVGGASSLHGWLLLFHFAAGPLFLLGLALVAIFGVSRRRVALHLVIMLGLFTTGTILLAMTQLLSSNDQHLLYDLHRYGAAPVSFGIVWLIVRRHREPDPQA